MDVNHLCLCVFIAVISVIVIECDCRNENQTMIPSNAKRFEKILHRKRRFLLFPPGAAIVTTLSFTKTLVPTSPSGINMIGECDIFYPLQTQISDWYPTTKKPPPLPRPPEEDYEDDMSAVQNQPQQPLRPPLPPLPPPPPPQPQMNPSPPMNDFPTAAVSMPDSGQQNPNAVNGQFKFPSDQELGISAGTLVNDPNFNVGKHPGEIYVENGMPTRRRDPTAFNGNYKNRSDSQYRNIQYQPKSRNKPASFSMHEDNLWEVVNDEAATKWHPPQPFAESIKRQLNRLPYNRMRNKRNMDRQDAKQRQRRRRGAKERRDLYEQLESFSIFKNIDTKACILRIICETKHYLLPPGTSLFQDIFRVLFTLPDDETNENDNEYVQAMRSDENECRTKYAQKCRYSILGYLLSPERPIL